MRDFIEAALLTAVIILILVGLVISIVTVTNTVKCDKLSKVFKTPTMNVIDTCYIMTPNGDYVSESVYNSLRTYGE